MDKTWLHLNRLTPEYKAGARNFINVVERNLGYPDKILCLKDCRNLVHEDDDTVYEHLVIKGMDLTYMTSWYHHGEELESNEEFEVVERNDIYHLYKAAFADDKDDYMDEIGEEKSDQKFNESLEDASTPLYPGCTKYTKLSAIVVVFKLKASGGWSDKSFSVLLEILHDMLPKPNVMIDSMYKVKKFLRTFDLEYEKIHACVNDCCLFRKELKDKDTCPKCQASRWKLSKYTRKPRKGVPAKVLRYFPIEPRFRRMFRSKNMAENLRWHSNNKSKDGKMRHPVDSGAWESVDEKWPIFAEDPRNLRFGLSTDGFNPFGDLSSTYSCWPIMLVIYNLPPLLCMKKENIMLTLLIPGPKQPGKDIDVYLQPLLDDLQELWSNGINVFDAYSNEVFNLKAILMWTINDFPAYGNICGCYTKGKMACPLCIDSTHAQWLKHSKKFGYIGTRRFLSPSHYFRKRKSWFDGKEEKRSKPRIMTGKKMYEELKDFINDWGKTPKKSGENGKIKECKKCNKKGAKKGIKKGAKKSTEKTDQISGKKRKRGEANQGQQQSRWKKRSLLFDLPYWIWYCGII